MRGEKVKHWRGTWHEKALRHPPILEFRLIALENVQYHESWISTLFWFLYRIAARAQLRQIAIGRNQLHHRQHGERNLVVF